MSDVTTSDVCCVCISHTWLLCSDIRILAALAEWVKEYIFLYYWKHLWKTGMTLSGHLVKLTYKTVCIWCYLCDILNYCSNCVNWHGAIQASISFEVIFRLQEFVHFYVCFQVHGHESATFALLFLFCGMGNWTRGFARAGRIVSHWAITPALSYFSILKQVLPRLPKLAQVA